MYNFLLAQVFGVLGIISSVLSMQFKQRKNILIMLLLLNLFSALNFLFLESYSSAYVCFFALIEMGINYLFERKNKKVPIYVIGIYVVINIILGLISYHSLIDILPIVCALIYCATVLVKQESTIRRLMIANQSIWLYVDIMVKAYAFSISNILTIISTIIAIFRYEKKKQ